LKKIFFENFNIFTNKNNQFGRCHTATISFSVQNSLSHHLKLEVHPNCYLIAHIVVNG
jgi:hypothetical protein